MEDFGSTNAHLDICEHTCKCTYVLMNIYAFCIFLAFIVRNLNIFPFVSLSQCEYKNRVSDAVQEMYEKFLGTLNLWISIVIYNIYLDMVNVHSEENIQFFY